MKIETFVSKWAASSAAERANKDHFLLDLCDVLGVERPRPTTGNTEQDVYTFERDAVLVHEGQKTTAGKMDLYKQDYFILEAKQGSEQGSKKLGTAKRGTAAWNLAMHDAFGQAVGYARTLAKPPPFIITTDIGHCFELFAAFDGTGRYGPFPDVKRHRIYLNDLRQNENLDLLRAVFTDPAALDPSKKATRVTREVASHLAGLAKDLDATGQPPERVARFLMRAIFTMFAEDVGLLTENLFTDALDKYWVPHPETFPSGIEGLWQAMNEGKAFGFFPKLLRFNGGLFKDAESLPLTKEQLKLLREAAGCDWSEVEPSIFGTLLERALDPVERHRLGAHYTPRAYVERLVRPTVEEPLREEWDLVRAHVRSLVEKDEIKSARKALLTFQAQLAGIRVLDPACGTGNFLYVTLDLMKRLEAEVLSMLSDVEGGERDRTAGLSGEREGWAAVTPRQFLGIEVKPWAKEIAELVLWIGYLQWHFRTHGRDEKPAEPVLHDFGNIECRDAVLAWDSVEPQVDAKGKVLTHWDGRTMKVSPVTGKVIPDDTAQVPLYRYVNPRRADWPKADFIVGNPPFIGNKRMRDALGDGYVEALRAAHVDVPDNADFVMFWWNHAATLVCTGEARRFGLITTNSISQTLNRGLVARHLASGLKLTFAIPDHPWVDSADGAAVRIAMTVGAGGAGEGIVAQVVAEDPGTDGSALVKFAHRNGVVHADLSIGPNVLGVSPLLANKNLCFQGVILVGDGFRITPEEVKQLGFKLTSLPPVIKPYMNAKDLVQVRQDRFAIDLAGLTEHQVRDRYPALYQHVHDTVRPHRVLNRDAQRKRNWWLFGRSNEAMRTALLGLDRYVVVPETSTHKPFVFAPGALIPDHKLYAIATDDAFVLGVLSTRAHLAWALAAGGHLGVGNDPTWTNTTCFLPFPFPVVDAKRRQRIAQLAEDLDGHRKREQAQHPGLTLTGIYNVLAKLRAGEPLTARDKAIHDQGLVSVLKQLHDELDAAVFDAYGWPRDLTDEQILVRLVALNAERAAEEARGLVRWLRPDFQAKGEKKPTQATLIGEAEPTVAAPGKSAAPWPKSLPEQIAAVRSVLAAGEALSVKAAAKAFRRADKADLQSSLDALVALGLAVAFSVGGERRWRVAGRVAA
jgi:hypothetical protein